MGSNWEKYDFSFLMELKANFMQLKEYKVAEKYLLDALTFDRKVGALSDEMEFELALSELYSKTNKDKLAIVHFKKAVALKDTIFNQEKDKEITRKEMNYEFDKKEAASKAEQDKKERQKHCRKYKSRLGFIY